MQPYRLHSLLVCSLVCTFVAAAPAYAAPDEPPTFHLNIDAQPLADALQEFARQTGIQIVFMSAIAEGRRPQRLVGEYTSNAGLDALLAGSGLTYRVLNATTVQIVPDDSRHPAAKRPAAEASTPIKSTEMEEVTVRSTAEQLVATRTQTPLREIPQTISIITHEQIEQENDTDFTDALRHAPGVSVARNDSLDPDLYVRGFKVTSLHIDGGAALPFTAGNFVRLAGTPDLSEFDHIEVLRGADGLFGGNGNPGATVSLVRKRPEEVPAFAVNASAGSWNNYRMEVDATGPLALDGALRGRAGGVYIDRDYFYSSSFLKRRKIFGMLEYALSPDTTLTLGGSYQSDRALPFSNGLPRNLDGSDPHLSRDTSLTTDWSFYRSQVHQAWMQLHQRFGNNWTVRLNLLADQGSTDFLTAFFNDPIDPATGALLDVPTASGTSTPDTLSHFSANLTLTGRFELLGRRIELAAGGDFMRANTVASLSLYNVLAVIQNIHAFAPDLYPDPRLTKPALAETNRATTLEKGAFASVKAHLSDAWSAIAGARVSNDYLNSRIYSPVYPQLGTTRSVYDDPHIVSPYGALLYELNKHYSVYTSYADIYQSNVAAVHPDGTPLGAQHGADAEVGIKGAWREGSLNATLAAYKIDQSGVSVLETVPGFHPGLCCFSQGVNKSSGVDVELSGAVAPGWLLGTGYTYSTNRAADISGRQPGDVALSSFVPKHLFKAWTSTRLPGRLSRWTVGGNIQLQSHTWTNGQLCGLDASGRCGNDGGLFRITQGGYAVVDARIGYQLGSHWRVALRANNVFDKTYYESLGAPSGNNWYGEPRNFLLQINSRF